MEEEKQIPEQEEKPYVPRPAWQVWAAPTPSEQGKLPSAFIFAAMKQARCQILTAYLHPA